MPSVMVSSSLLEAYEDYLTLERRLSSSTIRMYTQETRRFIDYLDNRNVSSDSFDSVTLVQYVSERTRGKTARRTTAKLLSIIHSYCLFLIEERVRNDNPSDKLESPKSGRIIPDVLELYEVERILDVIPTSTVLGIRDKALIELIYSAGLRASEAVGLRMGDVILEEELIRVIGKRDKERLLPLGRRAAAELKVYLKESRPHLANAKTVNDAVFLSELGKPLNRKSLWVRFKKYAADAGLSAKVHTLRHSYATHLLSGGADLRIVQELLGHSSISTTQIYTHIDRSQLQSQFNEFHPGANVKKTKN
jgi:integrase/recombinase XerD